MSTSDSSVTFLPNAPPVEVAPGITVQPPLSRRGTGPPLVVLVDGGVDLGRHEKTVDPPPLLKWAEEGFAVAQIVREEDDSAIQSRLQLAVEQLTRLSECEAKNGVALLIYSEMVGEWINDAIRALPGLSVVVSYGCSFKGVVVPVPSIAHIPTPIGQTELPQTTATSGITIHTYHGVGAFFAIPAHTNYRAGAAGLAHSRSLAFVKDGLGGPHFDLATIWDEHTRFEFADRSVARTMATMVAEPYVNHIPTLTGGVGRRHLTAFYRDHFIFSNPADTELELVSRTVGTDRIVDEFLFKCTHDRVIDWLAPGIPPTGKHVSIPFTSVVNIRGDRPYHEHIAWDQGTLLKQLGLLPDWLPFPYPLPDGRTPGTGKRFEYRVPVAGVECAQKLVDESSVESNGMFDFQIREVDDV